MKKTYEEAEMNIIVITNIDIITESKDEGSIVSIDDIRPVD